MLQIVRLLDDHSAREHPDKPAFHFFEIVDLHADMVQAVVGLHLAQLGTVFEKGQIIKTVGDGDIAVRRATEFFGAEKTVVEID